MNKRRFTSENREKQIFERADLTDYVTHCTRARPDSGLSAMDVLFKILKEKRLNGSKNEGFIIGNTPAVCFQETPFSQIKSSYEQKIKNDLTIKYELYGLVFPKDYIYRKGGRPVIYDNRDEVERILRKSKSSYLWRIVNFNLEDPRKLIDWTHEREWRVPCCLEFEYREVGIILPNKRTRNDFYTRAKKELINEGVQYPVENYFLGVSSFEEE